MTCNEFVKSPEWRLSILPRVKAQYSKNGLAYHNLSHIEYMLSVFRSNIFRPGFINPGLVELAIWYHDIVYIPMDKDNEFHSALCAEAQLSSYLEADEMKQLKQYIQFTDHKLSSEYFNYDLQCLLEIDLFGLAADWDVFEHNSACIREEFRAKVSSDLGYFKGRREFLQTFLDARPRKIFFSIGEFYSEKARKNILAEIANLDERIAKLI